MVRAVKIALSDAQQTKQDLQSFLSRDFYVKKEDGYIYFPVIESYTGETVDVSLRPRSTPTRAIPFKEALQDILTPEELSFAKTAYEVVGSIAIIEVPDDLLAKEKEIGQCLLSSNPKIKTVLRKLGGHQGTFRSQDMKVIAGVPTTVATSKESNTKITYDVTDMYFSARLATERKRIYRQVKEGEEVLVMFSGAAPYVVVLAKNSPAKSVVGVEINPSAHEFALQNITQNKIKNASVHCGDARVVLPTLNQTFDRIIMPLPKTAETFLDCALAVAKENATIHLYGFYHEDEFEKAYEHIDAYCKQANRNYTLLSTTKVGQQSPRTYRICVDFSVHPEKKIVQH